MESFYGGRQGASIVIKARFKYITDEIANGEPIDPYYAIAYDRATALPEGTERTEALNALAAETMTIQLSDPSYTDVWYNEYCIIDAANKNNVNNGRIYRRTLKSTNDEDPIGRVAEYIGQIVGPTGSSPQLGDVVSVSALTQKFNTDKANLNTNIDDVLTYIGERTIDGELVEEWTVAKGNQSDPPMKIRPLISGTNLISGNTQINNEYVQQGEYGWYNIRKNTSDTDTSLVYLGFDIPYYVTEFENGNVLSYAQTETTVTKTINTGQTPIAPFYEKYQINVPRGVPGAWIDNLRWIADSNNAVRYYPLSGMHYNAPTQANNWIDSWSQTENDILIYKNVTVWLCDFHWVNKNGVQQDVLNLYIGKYKAINNIRLTDEGTLIITYTDAPTQNVSLANQITWITDALVVTGREEGGNLDRYIGHLLVKFNNDTIMQDKQIGGNNNNYSKYVDLGLVKTIQEGLFVESKNYQVSVAANASFADIELAVRDELNDLTEEATRPEDAPSHEKALIVTVIKGEEPSAETEKTIAYWNNGANSGNGQWELLGDTVSGGGGRAEHGAILDGTGLEVDDTDLVLSGYSISSDTLTNYPPVFPE